MLDPPCTFISSLLLCWSVVHWCMSNDLFFTRPLSPGSPHLRLSHDETAEPRGHAPYPQMSEVGSRLYLWPPIIRDMSSFSYIKGTKMHDFDHKCSSILHLSTRNHTPEGRSGRSAAAGAVAMWCRISGSKISGRLLLPCGLTALTEDNEQRPNPTPENWTNYVAKRTGTRGRVPSSTKPTVQNPAVRKFLQSQTYRLWNTATAVVRSRRRRALDVDTGNCTFDAGEQPHKSTTPPIKHAQLNDNQRHQRRSTDGYDGDVRDCGHHRPVDIVYASRASCHSSAFTRW